MLSLSFSQPIYIDRSYCVEQTTIKPSFFGYKTHDKTDDPVLVEIPKDRMQYSVASSSILSYFNDRNISVIDTSDGVIIFKQECMLMGKADEIQALFLKKFQELSPYVIIETPPRISVKASLPPDFKRYQLVDIVLSNTTLKKTSGSFAAVFSVGNKERKLYFAYDMQAKVRVFKAKRNLLNGTILTNDDFETTFVSLDNLPTHAIVQDIGDNLIVKNSIKEGQVLTDYLFDIRRLVYKKEAIKALYKDDGLVIEVPATLLDDGDLGDTVKIKTEQGKVLNAKIISSKEAIIVE